MILLMEGMVMCFVLLLICVIGISNGPVGLVVFYEKEVQERVVELGYITKKKMKKISILSSVAIFVPVLVFVPFMVYYVNGASGFFEGFIQMTIILLIEGVFDRIFIDWYWVGHTKAWLIPNTEDLQPYIPKKVLISKWVGTLVGFPMIAAIIAGIMNLR